MTSMTPKELRRIIKIAKANPRTPSSEIAKLYRILKHSFLPPQEKRQTILPKTMVAA